MATPCSVTRRAAGMLIAASMLLLACGEVDETGGAQPSPPDASADVGAESIDPPPALEPIGGTRLVMDFASAAFYDAPFPSEHRRRPDGGVDLSGFPNPGDVDFVNRGLTLITAEADGFGSTSAITFRATGALSGALPSALESVGEASPIRLIDVTAGAPQRLDGAPFTVDFRNDSGPFGAEDLLTLLPVQGMPLLAGHTYAAVVRRSLNNADGVPLGRSTALTALLNGERPSGLAEPAYEAYRDALVALEEAGIPRNDVAGLAVFTTGDPTAGMREYAAAIRAEPLPTVALPIEAREVFDDYCVYESTLQMPVYQAGEPPFSAEGGGWARGPDGAPQVQALETARLVLTIPRSPAPAAGYPVAVFIRTGGGGDRPLVDRGVRTAPGEPSTDAGGGPARMFAAAGFVGVSVDGPHGGLRNVTGGDEQFLMFNVTNPHALRDNVRQSALELIRLVDVLEALTPDASACPGAAAEAELDTSILALMGHSMGATIAPLVMAVEPRYRALILSGAGGSWIANIVHKKSPVDVKPLAEAIVGYGPQGLELHEHDPVLSVLQWAGEAADPPVYGRSLITAPGADAPRHVLMLQGIVDTYILPPIANATSLSIGLDLGGAPLDAGHPDLTDLPALEPLLPLAGRARIELPAATNRAPATAIVVQHAEDGIEDGHEVAFQTDAPKYQYRCFLAALAAGEPPVVAAPAPLESPCPP